MTVSRNEFLLKITLELKRMIFEEGQEVFKVEC